MMPIGGGAGHGYWRMMHGDDEPPKPTLTRDLLRRVAAYAWPYRWRILLMLAAILGTTALGLVPPLILRDLIDNALPQHNAGRLDLLAAAMVAVPILSGLLGVLQRYLTTKIGEGIIFDLRRSLYDHMQRMSLRFFTSTKTGELMSRLNNDVVGAQQAVTSTVTSIISNAISLVSVLAIMLALEWRLTLLAIVILPLFILPSKRVAKILRDVSREQLERQAQMNALMNETLNVSGALLVKLFGRAPLEMQRFAQRAAAVRDLGIKNAIIGRWFFFGLSLSSAIGTALVFLVGGHLVLAGLLSIGTLVAFAAYLGQLYGPITALTNARVDFATSMVSFERVFEVLDLPIEIAERPDPIPLDHVQGRVTFDHVWFSYRPDDAPAATLKPVERRRRDASDRPLSEGDDLIGSQTQGRRDAGTQGGEDAATRRRGDAEAPGVEAGATDRRGDTGMEGGNDGARFNLAWTKNGNGFSTATAGTDADNSESLGDSISASLRPSVSTSTSQARVWALEDVSFDLEPGQLVALVGPSGAGKTTLTYLLPRLYDPTRGRILIDGHDLRDLSLQSLGEQIGMVTQETYLFHDTIRANLLYARPDASFDEVVAACQAANIHDFIADLPKDYDTVVGERGYRLSGGEKQRIAIARVILKDPKILVLDEATSHLDSHSEALIQAALERVMRGRTSLVIAHRLSTVLAADRILVVDRGHVAEQGTHAQLIAQDGLYAALYQTQFRTVAAGLVG